MSKGGLTMADIKAMTYGEASSWFVALGEANGGTWEPTHSNPLNFKKPEMPGG